MSGFAWGHGRGPTARQLFALGTSLFFGGITVLAAAVGSVLVVLTAGGAW